MQVLALQVDRYFATLLHNRRNGPLWDNCECMSNRDKTKDRPSRSFPRSWIKNDARDKAICPVSSKLLGPRCNLGSADVWSRVCNLIKANSISWWPGYLYKEWIIMPILSIISQRTQRVCLALDQIEGWYGPRIWLEVSIIWGYEKHSHDRRTYNCSGQLRLPASALHNTFRDTTCIEESGRTGSRRVMLTHATLVHLFPGSTTCKPGRQAIIWRHWFCSHREVTINIPILPLRRRNHFDGFFYLGW